MKSVSDLLFSFLRFLGLLDDHPILRKNIKRNRVFDDFSSDDDTPVLGYRQFKKFRWSDIEAIDNHDKVAKHSVRTVPVQTEASYATSTPKESSKRTLPVDHPHLTSTRPSMPLKRSTPPKPVINADLEQEGLKVKSKSNKKAPIQHVDIDDDDNDEVVFVKEVATPPEEPRQLVQDTNSHPCAYDKILSEILEATKSDVQLRKQLQRIVNTIASMPKEKPIGDSKLAENTASKRTPQKTKINEIKLDSKLNADRHQNAPQKRNPIRVSLTDSSDSDDDIEIIPTSSTTSKTNSARKFEKLSRNWLLELDSIYNNKQHNNHEKVNNARRVSDITSKANSNQNIAHSHGHDETDASEDLLSKLASDYNITELHNKPKIQKTQEKHNDLRRASDITLNENSGKNEAGSSNQETIADWLARIDAKYFSTRLTPDKLDDIIPRVSEENKTQSYKLEIAKKRNPPPSQKQSNAPQVETVQKDVHASPLESTKEWLKKLEAEYFSVCQENLSNACHESNIVPKVHSELNLNTARVSSMREGSDYKTTFLKTQENQDVGRQKSDTRSKANSEENEGRLYLPAASRDWLSQLDAKYKTTPQNNQENLDNARKRLNRVSKVIGEQSKSRTVKPDNTGDWLEELRSRYNKVQRNKQEELNDARESSNENKPCSDMPDTTKEPSQQSRTQERPENAHQEVNNLSKTNSTQNEARSFNFNTSEELLSKLGCLYNKYQQENSNKSKSENVLETKSNELPVLTPEQDDLVDRAFEPEPEDELLIEKFNMRIHRRDLETLSDLNWLNDEIINFYMNLIMQRSEERKDLPKVYTTNTFFYPKLMQSGQPGLRRWTRKVDIFAYDLFMVPVNIGNHWCLCIVDFRARVIKYLDSQGVPNHECLDALLHYLEDEHEDKKGMPLDVKGWEMECVTDIPQQTNGGDCGMFACTFAEFSSRDAAYSFTQAHMPYLRRKAALEILRGKLLL